MNFHSTEFGCFLVVVFSLYWLLGPWRELRLMLLLVGSYFFYGSWSAKYLLLIVGSTLLDYWIGGRLAVLPADRRTQRRRLLWLSLIGNLGVLAVFKYYGFFRENVGELLSQVGLDLPALDWMLPVGISFYTFQSLSYTLDIYWGKIQPARNLREFALFVAFFPQLVAGPIVRASVFLPQLEKRPALSRQRLSLGLYRIQKGLAKKVLVADFLALHLVDPVFMAGSTETGPMVWLGVYAYALQIYCDFSGYSDIAIGAAILLGFDIPENFNSPYLARSIQDFWRRWHISLSQWLRDYLYIPLGGNRSGRLRTYANLMITMLLGGLWHGSQWNFVIWGGLHGLWLCINRCWDRRGFGRLGGVIGNAIAIVVTFHLVCFAWVFFRTSDLNAAFDLLSRAITPAAWPELQNSVYAAFALGLATHVLPGSWKRALSDRFAGLPMIVIGLLLSLFLGLLAVAAVQGVPFIYFQF